MAYGDSTKPPFSLSPINLSGCTDPAALNYNKNATKDDGSCTYASTSGCTDPTATNYNKLATVDDGSCTYASTSEVYGCTNPAATNYNKLATKDDGSCTYASMDPHLTKTVIEVGMVATLKDGWYLADPKTDYLSLDLNNPYEGPYHLMEDGTYMIGVGALNASHTINPKDVIFQDYSSVFIDELPIEGEPYGSPPETIQEVREIVSDLFYKLWFEEHTLSDEQVLSLQTSMRGGHPQTAGKDGRAEGEPLVFYKKDRNTLENTGKQGGGDLQGEEFENICQDIFMKKIPINFIPGMFEIYEPPEEPYVNLKEPITGTQYWKLQQYIMRYNISVNEWYQVVIAEEVILYDEENVEVDFHEDEVD